MNLFFAAPARPGPSLTLLMNHRGPCPHPALRFAQGHLLPEGEGLTRALALSPWERVAEGRVRANSLRRSFLSSSARCVLLAPFARGDWRTLLYGVNAGGCGTIIS